MWTLTKKLLIGRTKVLFAHYNVYKQWVLHSHHRDGHCQQVPSLIVLGDGGHRGMVNTNGCQELPLIPPVWITSTNRHTHLALDVGKVNQIGCWKGQGIRLDVGKVKESDWMLERSKESSGHVYWLRLFKQGGKVVILGSHYCSPYRGGHLWSRNHQLVEVIQTGGISGNSWQPLLFTVPWWPPSPSTIIYLHISVIWSMGVT